MGSSSCLQAVLGPKGNLAGAKPMTPKRKLAAGSFTDALNEAIAGAPCLYPGSQGV